MKEPRFRTRDLVLVGLFAALIIAFGYLYIPLPFTPVPITGQSLGVMLTGCILGRRLGPLAVIVFLVLAAIGAPVLAGGRGGLGVLVGPSGGYLAGYILAALVIGLLTERLHNRRRAFWGILIANGIGGIIAIYVPGIIYLAIVTHRSLIEALVGGAVPFLPGDLLKVLAATIIAEGVYLAYPVDRILAKKAMPLSEVN